MWYSSRDGWSTICPFKNALPHRPSVWLVMTSPSTAVTTSATTSSNNNNRPVNSDGPTQRETTSWAQDASTNPTKTECCPKTKQKSHQQQRYITHPGPSARLSHLILLDLQTNKPKQPLKTPRTIKSQIIQTQKTPLKQQKYKANNVWWHDKWWCMEDCKTTWEQ